MSKEIHIYTCALILYLLIGYSFFKWIVRGQLFHPGLIYAVINSLFFITFAFGPYKYNVIIDNSYYYMYAFITIAFTVGIVLGEYCKSRKVVKDISLNKAQLFLLYFIIFTFIFVDLINLYKVTNLNLEIGAAEKLKSVEESLEEKNINVNLLLFNSLNYSINLIFYSLGITYAFKHLKHLKQKKKKKYIPIALCLIFLFFSVFSGMLKNSRTEIVIRVLMLIISYYTVIQTVIQNNYKKNKLEILFWILNKNKWNIFFLIIILSFLIMIVTNTRIKATDKTDAGFQRSIIIIEELYRAEKKQWFESWLTKASPHSVNTIVQLSLYSGGTVASGGVITRIATDTGLHTWGLRNFFVFHRVLAQLRLDGGFSNDCRENYYKVHARAIKEVPAILTGWFGDPGNLLLDFGYVGAPVASLITGWLVGWLYGSLCNSGAVIKATATFVFAIAMLLTPAGNVFSVLLFNSINFFILLLYLLTQKSVSKNIWSSSYNDSTKYQTLRRYRYKR